MGANPLIYFDPDGLAAEGAAVGGFIGGVLGGRFGGGTGARIGSGVGARIGSALQDICIPGDPCKELNDNVQRAKEKVGSLKPAACSQGMSRWELQQRYDAWLDEATARSKRDQVCWSGGDAGHQQAQASAWSHVGKCGRLLQ